MNRSENCRGKLIVTDIDGTFFDRGGRIPQRNRDAVERFKAAGGRFTFATGRVQPELGEVIPDYREIINAPFIACNGAYLYDTSDDTIIYKRTVDGARLFPALSDVHEMCPNLTMWYHDTDNKIYLFRGDERFTLGSWCKLMVSAFDGATAEELARAREYLEKYFGESVAFSQSCPQLLELLDPAATKGQLLTPLREYLTARGEAPVIYAAGDYENDLDLLTHADIAVCPQNALDCVKARASRVLVHCDEGAIAQLIELIMNGEC